MIELVLWQSCVRAHGFDDQLAAAVAGGFTSLSIPPTDVRMYAEQGLDARTMRAKADDAGILLSDLDGISSWLPINTCADMLPPTKARFDITLDECIDYGVALGVRRMCVVGGFAPGDYSLQELVDRFGALCERAEDAGILVDLECMAFFGIDTVERGAAIVGGAGRPNGRLLIDTHHVARGDNASGAQLRSLPAELFRSVQLADGPLVMEGATLMEDSKYYRRLPGEGEFPIAEQLRTLHEKGTIDAIGVEVFSLELDQRPPLEAGRACGDALRACLAAAGITLAITPPVG
jgi:sugar phosphate isomerase/epimerase